MKVQLIKNFMIIKIKIEYLMKNFSSRISHQLNDTEKLIGGMLDDMHKLKIGPNILKNNFKRMLTIRVEPTHSVPLPSPQ